MSDGKIPVAKIEDVLDYSDRKLFYVISVLAGLGIVLALSMLAFNVHFRSRKFAQIAVVITGIHKVFLGS